MLVYLLPLAIFLAAIIAYAIRFDRRRKGLAQQPGTHHGEPNLEADLLAGQMHAVGRNGGWTGGGSAGGGL